MQTTHAKRVLKTVNSDEKEFIIKYNMTRISNNNQGKLNNEICIFFNIKLVFCSNQITHHGKHIVHTIHDNETYICVIQYTY